MKYDTCIFATRLHDFAERDAKEERGESLIHTTLERLMGVARADTNAVIVISVASWMQPKRHDDMLRVLKTFIGTAPIRNLIVVPWRFLHSGGTRAPETPGLPRTSAGPRWRCLPL